jgi:hypothetical protein
MVMGAAMSCPSICGVPRGARRRCVRLRALDAERAADRELADRGGEDAVEGGGGSGVPLELDPVPIIDGSSGRRGWPREARRQTDQHRKREAWPVPRERLARLLEAERDCRKTWRSRSRLTARTTPTAPAAGCAMAGGSASRRQCESRRRSPVGGTRSGASDPPWLPVRPSRSLR